MVRDLDERTAASHVPTCPAWTVRDVVAHVTGVVDDVLALRLDGIATDPWTAAQVDARRGRSLLEILDEWGSKAPGFEALLERAGARAAQPVADVVSHEHDVRNALGLPGARDSDAVMMGLAWVAEQVISSAANHGATLRIRTRDGAVDVGQADADATLEGEPWELLRALMGRRSIAQIRRMDWNGDLERALPGFAWMSLRPAAADIVE